MNIHANARLTPAGRRVMVLRILEEGWSIEDAAEAAGTTTKTATKWRNRYQCEGDSGLLDRSSAPKSIPHKTPPETEVAIETLRRLRKTAAWIAVELDVPISTVSAVLKRIGLGKLSRLDPPEPPNRYCRRRPGELLHVDIKKLKGFRMPGHKVLGRGPGRRTTNAGTQAVHVAVDDFSRLAYVEVLADEKAETTVGFLDRAVAWFGERDVQVKEVLSDNGSPYRSDLWRMQCTELGIKHLRTRPYRPRTNGKAERFIQTMLKEWAYGATYRDSRHRNRALQPWLQFYNHRRPHGSLAKRPPITSLEQPA